MSVIAAWILTNVFLETNLVFWICSSYQYKTDYKYHKCGIWAISYGSLFIFVEFLVGLALILIS